MELNLFDSLFLYRPTPDRNPLEDYITEILAFIFKKELAAEWIKFISRGLFNPKPDEVRVSTQHFLGKYGRADILFEWKENSKNRSLLVEHKIYASIGERGADESGVKKTQIDNYICYLSEMGDAKDHKIAILKTVPQPVYQGSSPYFLEEFTWGTFNEFLTNKLKTMVLPEMRFLCDQLSAFMRRKNMLFDNFTAQDLGSIVSYNEYRTKLSQLTGKLIATFERPCDIFREILKYLYKGWGQYVIGSHWGVIRCNKDGPANSNIWIHLGLSEYCDEKREYPLIILREQKIPDVQVMLRLRSAHENIEKVRETYGNVLDKVNICLLRIGISENKFELISEESFLCFSIRKPLTDFLKCKEQEGEVIRFLESGFKALSQLVEDGTLSKIVNDDCLK